MSAQWQGKKEIDCNVSCCTLYPTLFLSIDGIHRILVATSDGALYMGNIDPREGGECRITKEFRLFSSNTLEDEKVSLSLYSLPLSLSLSLYSLPLFLSLSLYSLPLSLIHLLPMPTQVGAGLVGQQRTYANVASSPPTEALASEQQRMGGGGDGGGGMSARSPPNQSHHTEEDDDRPPAAQSVHS